MSVFVDTGVIYAHHDTNASRHESGANALDAVVRSPEFGRVYTSDYVYDEVITLTQRRTGQVSDSITVGRRIRGEGYPNAFELLYSSPSLFAEAVSVYEEYADHEPSFTDAMTIAMVRYHEIDSVLSFDDDFDGVIDRLAPASVADRNRDDE